MNFFFSKIVNSSFDETIEKVTSALKEEGFGILKEIKAKETIKKKLNVDFRPYKILAAYNPPFARKALLAKDKISTILPCNVIIQETENGVEVAVVDPAASMQAVSSLELEEITKVISNKLSSIIERI